MQAKKNKPNSRPFPRCRVPVRSLGAIGARKWQVGRKHLKDKKTLKSKQSSDNLEDNRREKENKIFLCAEMLSR